jgi:FkbM family methyltransferase
MRLIKRNSRAYKPQLWENPWYALKRRTIYTIASRIRRGWLGASHTIQLRGFPLLMEVVPQYSIDRAIFLYGIWEISSTRFVERFLEQGMTFIDVGAATGYYSLIAAHLVGPGGMAYSFEPHPLLKAKLERNVALNSLRNVVSHPEAVAAHTGTIAFYETEDKGNYGTSSLILPPDQPTRRSMAPCVTLDDFVRSLPRQGVDLVKIDVEGAEMSVLEGATKLLSTREGPALLFESFDVEAVVVFLKSRGYAVRHIHYSLDGGLEFPEVGAAFNNPFADYEAPNYVALKTSGRFGSFDALAGKHARPDCSVDDSRRGASWTSC